ncbi:hypothetical protein O3P69_014581, partial [Scylla paramamosain]
SLLQRQLASLLQPLEVSRNPTVTGLEPLLSVRSAVIRRALSCLSGNCLSSAWCVKLLRISRLTSASSPLLSWLSRKLPRLTSW